MRERHIQVEITQKALIEVDGKILLVHGDNGRWEFPGGRVNEGEIELESAFKREIHEELSAKVNKVALLMAYLYKSRSNRDKLVILYTCTLETPIDEVKLQQSEIYGFQLFSRKDLAALMPIAANTRLGIQHYLSQN
jgi:8-oxo-dGTP pyrophosphatase MutT (NUDIX family)